MVRGIKLIIDPDLRQFVIVPVAANLIIFIILTYFFVQFLSGAHQSLLAFLPEWLSFLAHLLWVLIFLLFLLLYGYGFTLITNLIAAPFYGILSEKVESKLTGKALEGEPLNAMIPRVIGREINKLCYSVASGILVFLGLTVLTFIPVLNVAVPLLGMLWGSWVMAVQYVDYPADNHQVPFIQLRQQLSEQKWGSLGLGGCILFGSTVPIINIFIAPAAVAASTIYWLEHVKQVDKIEKKYP